MSVQVEKLPSWLIFSPFCTLFLSSVVFFAKTEHFFSLKWAHLSIFTLVVCDLGVTSKSFSSGQSPEAFPLCLFPVVLLFQVLYLRLFTILSWFGGRVRDLVHSSGLWVFTFSSTVDWRDCLSLLYALGTFLKNWLTIIM